MKIKKGKSTVELAGFFLSLRDNDNEKKENKDLWYVYTKKRRSIFSC